MPLGPRSLGGNIHILPVRVMGLYSFAARSASCFPRSLLADADLSAKMQGRQLHRPLRYIQRHCRVSIRNGTDHPGRLRATAVLPRNGTSTIPIALRQRQIFP